MKPPQAPGLEKRRTADFAAEMRERALAWIPSWGLADAERDFGRALLRIAARFNSEVAERLDRAGDKMSRGFLDWLGVRGKAARPARLPVVFKLIDAAREPVPAPAPVRLQADAGGAAVIFETETDLRVVPGRVEMVVGVDGAKDAIYLPAPGLSDLNPLEPLPAAWRLKSFAAAGATTLQLDPEAGLAADMILQAAGQQYKIVKADKDLVTIEPPLAEDLADKTVLSKVTTFSPFSARNWQEHALYIGDADLLNLDAEATIEVVGVGALQTGIDWQYWGKVGTGTVVDWQRFSSVGPSTTGDAILLAKSKGAIETLEINGRSARWIRAFTRNVDAAQDPFRIDTLSLKINSAGCNQAVPCPAAKDAKSPAAEGMANTTPLVLENVFFPLGKEPRQFDAFYLGSQEAFSKTDANVQLCFEMSDRTFFALSAVRAGNFATKVLAGVAKDGALHLLTFDSASGAIGKFRQRQPLQPPSPGYHNQAVAGVTTPLDQQPGWRLPVWSEDGGFSVAVPSGDVVWVWREDPVDIQTPANQSGWQNFLKLPLENPTANAKMDGLVYLEGTPAKLVALHGGQLFIKDATAGATWTKVTTQTAGVTPTPVTLASIVPVLVNLPGRLGTSTAEGMVGVDTAGELYQVTTAGLTVGTCTPILAADTFDTAIRPVAFSDGAGELTVAGVNSASDHLIANQTTPGRETVALAAGTTVFTALEALLDGSTFDVVASVQEGAASRIVTWAPFAAAPGNVLYKSPVATAGDLHGAPTAVAGSIVVPGTRADIFNIKFDPTQRFVKHGTVKAGLVAPDSLPALAANDVVTFTDGGPADTTIAGTGLVEQGEVFYPLDAAYSITAGGAPVAYHLDPALTGTFVDTTHFTLHAGDLQTQEHAPIWIGGHLRTVDTITAGVAEFHPAIASPPAGQVMYARPIVTGGRIAPYMDLDNSNGFWDRALLDRLQLTFFYPGATPPQAQWGKAFSIRLPNNPHILVLADAFLAAPPDPISFVVDAAFDQWLRDAGDTSSNPELSWEYWNGKGWWRLDLKLDQTQNLKLTGAVQFTVPVDIASSDWAGKTNYWIRARLIGGDYGREKVTVKTKDLGGGVTEQTVERSTEGIRAPSVLRLTISYSVCKAVKPAFVQTLDSLSFRDQSDANRTDGAVVEAFVPLAVTLGNLAKAAAPVASGEECPPECDCPGEAAAADPAGAAAASTADLMRETGRALFIGASGALSGAPVNIFFLVDEQDHSLLAPMAIEALVADRLVRIVANDATRALGESGLLTMAFAVPPTAGELFGKTSTWLRLKPKTSDSREWTPAIRGVYLNAVWASATETLTRELLGSSEGAPNLTVTLARPPVLHNTLELRVKEPLGEEDRQKLLREGADRVLYDLPDLPGDWVLWRQVVDPLDEPAGQRVYSLDEGKGEIRFGDGLHGYIPPIGQDSIVAFRYQRTEPGAPGSDTVPGNAVTSRTPLNLVSPVPTVETVIAADQGAGGTGPESDTRVLRFGFAHLRHHDRAITTADLEDLALESSPDIVQARAIARIGYIRLVVVMRGSNPRPSAAQIRELRRLLLASSPAQLSADNVLRIEGPQVRRLRVTLTLEVDTLDHAGALAESVKQRLARFFDTATGGVDQDGWALGVNPREEDIAYALVDTPYLESIGAVVLSEAADDNGDLPWPASLKTNELAMLADDPIRIEFEPVSDTAGFETVEAS